MSSADDGVAPLVELRGVERRYPNGTIALQDVSLTIRAGESVAIIGRSGSGKSTLLNILGLLDTATDGQLLIDGQPVPVRGDRARAAVRASMIGFVFQRAHLIADLSVRQNIELGSAYGRSRRTDAARSAADALAAVDLTHRVDATARTLSGGEMQRAAIARTLVRPARLWLADEPTGNLDSRQSGDVITLLKNTARDRGAALVVVTHEPDIAAQLDRTITLRDGRVISDTRTPDRVGDSLPTLAEPSPVALSTHPGRARALGQSVRRTARFVAQTVMAQRTRTRTHVIASAIAVALTLTSLGLAESARSQVTSMFDARRASQVIAQITTTEAAPDPRWPLNLDALADFPGVTAVEYWRHHRFVPITNGAVTAMEADIIEVDSAPGAATDSAVTWAPGHDKVLAPGDVLLGAVLAERLGITQLSLQPDVTIAGTPHRVAGLVTDSRSGTAVGSAFIPATTAHSFPPTTERSLAVTTTPGAARMVADRLPLLIDPYQQTDIRIDPVLAADAYRAELERSVTVSLNILAIICAIAGLGVVIFVSLLGITTRAAEFGVRRAFGARRSEIVTLVLGECALLGAIGAIIGLAAGFTTIMALTALAHWQPVFNTTLLTIPLFGTLTFGFLGGLPPAIAASRIEPADAVRT